MGRRWTTDDLTHLLDSTETRVAPERVRQPVKTRWGMSTSWTSDEDDFLRRHYPTQGQAWCATALQRSGEAIRQRTSTLRLRLDPQRAATSPVDKNRQRQPAARGHPGTRQDLGIYVRSAWEANYARYLNWLLSLGAIAHWEYEPETFLFDAITHGTRSYTPDFKIWETPESVPYYVELKGWMDRKSQTKLKRMAKYYPEITIQLVDTPAYAYLCRQLSRLIVGWE